LDAVGVGAAGAEADGLGLAGLGPAGLGVAGPEDGSGPELGPDAAGGAAPSPVLSTGEPQPASVSSSAAAARAGLRGALTLATVCAAGTSDEPPDDFPSQTGIQTGNTVVS
jgi:hypothetical protein